MTDPEIFHSNGCGCPGCMGQHLHSTSDEDTPVPPGVEGASKPVYSDSEVTNALTTSDGRYSSIAWAGEEITYSIGIGKLLQGHAEWDTEHNGYVAMSAAMEAQAADAFELWDDLIAIDLVALEDDPFADISFNYSAATNNATYAQYSYQFSAPEDRADFTIVDSDLWFAHNWFTHDQDSDLTHGGYGILTYLHEIGHALGLSHPGNYNGTANFQTDATHFQDTRGYTLMSYFNSDANGSGTDHVGGNGRSYGATPLLHDILTIQEIYGADMTTRTNATTYGFNSTADRDSYDFTKNTNPVVAIWDAGGVDKIDVSGWNTNQTVDLNEGAFSSVGLLTDNLAIAYGAVIELAETGGGNDTLIGNAAGNVLTGNGGNDTLFAGDGNDVLWGGEGADVLDGGVGIDWARFALSTLGVKVNLNGGTGSGGDAEGDIYTGIEHVSGSGNGDELTGDHVTSNQLYGLDGDDVIYGGGGHDFMLGGAGDDEIYGGTGRDLLRGGEGADTLDGGSSADWIQYHDASSGVALSLAAGGGTLGDAAGDVFISIEHVRGSNFDDHLIGDGARNILQGQDGNDLLEGNGGSDVFYGEGGDDTIIGSLGQDTLLGGAGADHLDGAEGNDWARYTQADEGVSVSLLTGTGTGGEAAGDVLVNIEWLWGSDHDDVLEGDHGVNIIRGGAGDDVITGHQGNDILQGYGGADTFVFRDGDGIDRIHAYEMGTDLIRIIGSVTDFGQIVVTDFRGDAAIDYGSGGAIVLNGIDHTDVDASFFVFG